MENTTGVNEDYKAMAETLEKQNKGMYAEMKAEREKRQALEDRLAQVEKASRTNSDSGQDENLKWINKFAVKPREVLREEFDEYAKPIRETNTQLVQALNQREALDWLSEQENVPVSKVKKGELLKDLERIGKEHNLGPMPLLAGTQAAYELLKLERKRKEEEEKERAAVIQDAQTQSTSAMRAATGAQGRVFKESEIAAMDTPTFQHHSKDIALAKSEGRIVLDLSKPNEKGRLEIPR